MTAQEFQFEPFKEAVVIVSDLESTSRFYVDVIGWELVSALTDEPNMHKAWCLPASVSIRSCLVRFKGAVSGGLRLVEVKGAEQQYIRPNSQIWDTGGIYDLNTRVTDIFSLAMKLHRFGWFAGTEPVEMVFGENKVYEWLAKGHDGIVYALIERIHPPLNQPPTDALFSALFNSSVVVTDYSAEVDFYRNVLGFELLVQQHDTFNEARPNVFALPLNLVNNTPYQLTMLAPPGAGLGGVEICHFPQLAGNDFSQRAQPPNIGIVTLRFPVKGLEAFKARLIANSVTIMSDSEQNLGGYGNVRLISARTPNKNWIEFFEYQ